MSKPPRERFQELLETFSVGILVTEGPDGVLTGRPMNVAAIDSDADVWFCTQVDSPKAEDVTTHPDVLIAFQDAARYLTVNGSARLVRDRSKIDELWNESWKIWFPGGQSDPTLALLHVSASHGQYWDNSWQQGLRYAIRAGQAYLTGDTPEVPKDVNAKVALP